MTDEVTMLAGSKERVAYDMAERIRIVEDKKWERTYIVTLYSECLNVVNGYPPK